MTRLLIPDSKVRREVSQKKPPFFVLTSVEIEEKMVSKQSDLLSP